MTDERISYNDLMERWRTAKTRVRKLEAVVEALDLMLVSPKSRMEYCAANGLLPDPVTVEASVDDYWRKAIAKRALADLENLTTPAK